MRRRSILRRFYAFTWRYKMTPAGKMLTGIVGVTSLGMITTLVPIYQVCCTFLGLLLAAELFGLVFKPSLTVTPTWPRTLAAGEATSIPVKITNASKWRAAYDVMLLILDRPQTLLHINGGDYLGKISPKNSSELTLEVLPSRRGVIRPGGLDAHSTFPFNLIRSHGGRTPPLELIVLPAAPPLMRVDLPVEQGAAVGEFVMSGQAGDSTEYLGNRDYTPGEPVRRLDFRAWARLGKPVVREYQDEHASRVGLVIDTLAPERTVIHRLLRRGPVDLVEESISLGASIIDAVLGENYQIPFLATASDLYQFQDGMDRGQRDELLERLALALPTTTPVYDAMLDSVLAASESCAAVVVVLAAWDDDRRRFLDGLTANGPPLKVILLDDAPAVHDQATIPPGFDGVDRTVLAAALVREQEVSVL